MLILLIINLMGKQTKASAPSKYSISVLIWRSLNLSGLKIISVLSAFKFVLKHAWVKNILGKNLLTDPKIRTAFLTKLQNNV